MSRTLQPPPDHLHHVRLLRRRQFMTRLDTVPFRQTSATAGGGGVLGDEDWMAAHGCLFAIVRRMRGGETRGDDLGRMLQNLRHPATLQVLHLLLTEPKPAAKVGALQCAEQCID